MNSIEILRVLGTQYNLEILAVTDEPKSADEISEDAEVPIGTTYRRISDLTEKNLLIHEDDVLTDDRRRKSVYRRGVDEIQVEFRHGELRLDITERSHIKNKLDDVWRTLNS